MTKDPSPKRTPILAFTRGPKALPPMIPLTLLLLLLALSTCPIQTQADPVSDIKAQRAKDIFELYENFNVLLSKYTWNAFNANPNSFLFPTNSQKTRRGSALFRKSLDQELANDGETEVQTSSFVDDEISKLNTQMKANDATEFELVIEEMPEDWRENIEKVVKEVPDELNEKYLETVKDRAEAFNKKVKPNIEVDSIPLSEANSPTTEAIASNAATLEPEAAQQFLAASELSVKTPIWESFKAGFNANPLGALFDPAGIFRDLIVPDIKQKFSDFYKTITTKKDIKYEPATPETKEAVGKKDVEVNEAKKKTDPTGDDTGQPDVLGNGGNDGSNDNPSGDTPSNTGDDDTGGHESPDDPVPEEGGGDPAAIEPFP
eukprot:Nk52_evm25s163 gene=Nk52_evmTU25s163